MSDVKQSRQYIMRKQWCDACLSVGIPALSLDTSAQIFAILLEWGNNEAFVLSGHFLADSEYIQTRYRVSGGETPDPDFAEALRYWVYRLRSDAIHKDGQIRPPEWATELMQQMYEIKI